VVSAGPSWPITRARRCASRTAPLSRARQRAQALGVSKPRDPLVSRRPARLLKMTNAWGQIGAEHVADQRRRRRRRVDPHSGSRRPTRSTRRGSLSGAARLHSPIRGRLHVRSVAVGRGPVVLNSELISLAGAECPCWRGASRCTGRRGCLPQPGHEYQQHDSKRNGRQRDRNNAPRCLRCRGHSDRPIGSRSRSPDRRPPP
jgi:hypothetical protein